MAASAKTKAPGKIPRGFFVPKIGDPDRTRTDDLCLDRASGYVPSSPASYVLDPLDGIGSPIFVSTIPYRHAYSLEVG